MPSLCPDGFSTLMSVVQFDKGWHEHRHSQCAVKIVKVDSSTCSASPHTFKLCGVGVETYAEVRHLVQYAVLVRNGFSCRALLELELDGEARGQWWLQPFQEIAIERTADNASQKSGFTFVRESEAKRQDEVRVTQHPVAPRSPENGLVTCTFTPISMLNAMAAKSRHMWEARRVVSALEASTTLSDDALGEATMLEEAVEAALEAAAKAMRIAEDALRAAETAAKDSEQHAQNARSTHQQLVDTQEGSVEKALADPAVASVVQSTEESAAQHEAEAAELAASTLASEATDAAAEAREQAKEVRWKYAAMRQQWNAQAKQAERAAGRAVRDSDDSAFRASQEPRKAAEACTSGDGWKIFDAVMEAATNGSIQMIQVARDAARMAAAAASSAASMTKQVAEAAERAAVAASVHTDEGARRANDASVLARLSHRRARRYGDAAVLCGKFAQVLAQQAATQAVKEVIKEVADHAREAEQARDVAKQAAERAAAVTVEVREAVEAVADGAAEEWAQEVVDAGAEATSESESTCELARKSSDCLAALDRLAAERAGEMAKKRAAKAEAAAAQASTHARRLEVTASNARQALDDVIEAAKVAPCEEIALVEETLKKMREAVRESEEFAAQGARAAEEAAHAALAAAKEARARLREPGEDEDLCEMAEAHHQTAFSEKMDYVHEQTSAFERARHERRAAQESYRRQDELISELSPLVPFAPASPAIPSASAWEVPPALARRKGNPMWRPGGTELRGQSMQMFGPRRAHFVDRRLSSCAQVQLRLVALAEESSTWEEYGGKELELHLSYTTLINVRWMLRFAKGEVSSWEFRDERVPGGSSESLRVAGRNCNKMPAWQQLPPDGSAEVVLEQLEASRMEYGLPIGVLSYGWCGRSHPDEQGVHLQRLIPLLEAIVRECDCVGPDFTWGIVWDFASLPQRGYSKGFDAAQEDRSELEVGRFRCGLFNINEWYAARFTHVFVLDGPMPQGSLNMREPFLASGFGEEESGRGWCIFERRLSSLIKDQGCFLQLSGMSEEMRDWELIRERCKASRPPPMSPETFADMFARGVQRESEESGTGISFTNKSDLTNVVIPQYTRCFHRLLKSGSELMYGSLGWKDEQIKHLMAAVTSATTSRDVSQPQEDLPLKTLVLFDNQFGADGIDAIFSALQGGALPKLTKLFIGKPSGGEEADAAHQRLGEECKLRNIVFR
uniref:Uncharacterized protein n=1 Tax=Noctiluca scintillans TaxID=2966 RepID=A0A7S0ZUJ6_NOCSC